MTTHAITQENFEDVVTENDIVFIDFWATWCGPCRAFGPIYEAESNKHDNAYFGKIDIDAQQELAAAAKIQAVPTLVGIKKGEVVFSQSGALRPDDLAKVVEEVINH